MVRPIVADRASETEAPKVACQHVRVEASLRIILTVDFLGVWMILVDSTNKNASRVGEAKEFKP